MSSGLCIMRQYLLEKIVSLTIEEPDRVFVAYQYISVASEDMNVAKYRRTTNPSAEDILSRSEHVD